MGNGGHHQRTKRMRTSFKHHQLRTMKSYFAINHNPDAKDLKQLSQKTGLPKRVLQVLHRTTSYAKIPTTICLKIQAKNTIIKAKNFKIAYTNGPLLPSEFDNNFD
ncbi:hypothetical protein AAG570_004401 [Ranatra chinensis]|uniref:Homeobox domain-containing protein n=1 Tax=Ranatra chinensis TaxID=642074 RepID=A0ABD0YFG8_9HEMI